MIEMMKASCPDWQGSPCTIHSIEKLIKNFSEGQFDVLADGNVVGTTFSIIVKYDDFGDNPT